MISGKGRNRFSYSSKQYTYIFQGRRFRENLMGHSNIWRMSCDRIAWARLASDYDASPKTHGRRIYFVEQQCQLHFSLVKGWKSRRYYYDTFYTRLYKNRLVRRDYAPPPFSFKTELFILPSRCMHNAANIYIYIFIIARLFKFFCLRVFCIFFSSIEYVFIVYRV